MSSPLQSSMARVAASPPLPINVIFLSLPTTALPSNNSTKTLRLDLHRHGAAQSGDHGRGPHGLLRPPLRRRPDRHPGGLHRLELLVSSLSAAASSKASINSRSRSKKAFLCTSSRSAGHRFQDCWPRRLLQLRLLHQAGHRGEQRHQVTPPRCCSPFDQMALDSSLLQEGHEHAQLALRSTRFLTATIGALHYFDSATSGRLHGSMLHQGYNTRHACV